MDLFSSSVLVHDRSRQQASEPRITGVGPVHFHLFDGNDVVLVMNRIEAPFVGTEVFCSRRPIPIGETVRVLFGGPIESYIPYKIRSRVTLGFTRHKLTILPKVPSIVEAKTLAGYWVSEQSIDSGTRLNFSVNPSGEIVFSDRGRTSTGPRVGDINVPLWAVVFVPEYDVYFDPGPVDNRSLSGPVPARSEQRSPVPVRPSESGTNSIQTPSSQSPSKIQCSSTQSSQEETLPRENTARGNPSTSPECIICYNEPPDTALSPCGHMYTCYNCALDIWQGRGRGKCPTCRKEITSILRVYKE